jgi:peptidyl-dipeptidase A
LSVITNKHLKGINLIENDQMNYNQQINFLMLIALKKLAFLPFAYILDIYRWNIFRGIINETNYNQKWFKNFVFLSFFSHNMSFNYIFFIRWEMVNKFQGIESPRIISEVDFDAAAKYHIASYTPYSRQFNQ